MSIPLQMTSPGSLTPSGLQVGDGEKRPPILGNCEPATARIEKFTPSLSTLVASGKELLARALGERAKHFLGTYPGHGHSNMGPGQVTYKCLTLLYICGTYKQEGRI
jgi:hypothetical protein